MEKLILCFFDLLCQYCFSHHRTFLTVFVTNIFLLMDILSNFILYLHIQTPIFETPLLWRLSLLLLLTWYLSSFQTIFLDFSYIWNILKLLFISNQCRLKPFTPVVSTAVWCLDKFGHSYDCGQLQKTTPHFPTWLGPFHEDILWHGSWFASIWAI